jgi:CheY-like chemotaxis protein
MTRTVLIVEDTDLCRETLEVALMGVPGVKLLAVESAEEALAFLWVERACALITDLHLRSRQENSMDGFELIERVRSLPQGSSLPILVISGDSARHTAARVEGLGANAFFAKPYSPAAVRTKLEQLIHASQFALNHPT